MIKNSINNMYIDEEIKPKKPKKIKNPAEQKIEKWDSSSEEGHGDVNYIKRMATYQSALTKNNADRKNFRVSQVATGGEEARITPPVPVAIRNREKAQNLRSHTEGLHHSVEEAIEVPIEQTEASGDRNSPGYNFFRRTTQVPTRQHLVRVVEVPGDHNSSGYNFFKGAEGERGVTKNLQGAVNKERASRLKSHISSIYSRNKSKDKEATSLDLAVYPTVNKVGVSKKEKNINRDIEILPLNNVPSEKRAERSEAIHSRHSFSIADLLRSIKTNSRYKVPQMAIPTKPNFHLPSQLTKKSK